MASGVGRTNFNFTSPNPSSDDGGSGLVPELSSVIGADASQAELVTGGRKDGRVFGYLSCAHVYYCLDIFASSIAFAHTFNSDLPLRRKLFTAGFTLAEPSNRLPQLFFQEARAIKLMIVLLIKLYKSGPFYNKMVEKDQNYPGQLPSFLKLIGGGHVTQYSPSGSSSQIPPPSPRDARSAEIVDFDLSCLEGERRLFGLIVSCLNEYKIKVKSGQLSALESMDEVVCAFIQEFQQFNKEEFKKHWWNSLDESIIDLIELG